MSSLSKMKCVPCRGDEPTVTEDEIADLKSKVPDWQIITQNDVKRLQRVFMFADFAAALAFTNRVGEIAEEEDHHPMLTTEWGQVTVTWWTHKINGLHQNDFIMAAKTDQQYSSTEN